MKSNYIVSLYILLSSMFLATASACAEELDRSRLKAIVDTAIEPIMKEHAVPGMAVGLTVGGEHYFFNYGVASKESGRPVTETTLFEVGSVSKLFAGLVGAWGAVEGEVSLTATASSYMPALRGSSFDRITLLQLATYTAGGLPLQFPREVRDEASMVSYFRSWKPVYPAGAQRVYSNPSIGLFGHLAAAGMGRSYEDILEGTILPGLGMANTYVRVPPERMVDYAFGYTKDGKPRRISLDALGAAAYGVRTSAADLLKFLDANIAPPQDARLRRAIAATQTGYVRVGAMTQGLGWERYDYPVALEMLVAGNTPQASGRGSAAAWLVPPAPPRPDVLLNKTGSTNGFGAYVAVVPGRRLGIVLLANRAYPNPDRVRAAHAILSAVADGAAR